MSVAEKMTAIADAIREKTGDTAKLSLDGMAEALRKLPGPIVATASGSPIFLADATDLKLRGLKLFGKTTQNGTPTPAAPVPLVSAGDGGSLGVTVAGKNLCPGYKTGAYVGSNGVYNQYLSEYYCTDLIPVKPGVVYAQSNGVSAFVADAHFFTIEKAWISKNSGNINTRPENAAYMAFNYYKSGDVGWVQVEVGTTATEYEPYTEQTLPVSTPNGLPGIPVTSGGNYTDETGQQWVCDEVDFGRGVYVQRVFTNVFSDASGWVLSSAASGAKRFGYQAYSSVIKGSSTQGAKANILCSSFPITSAEGTWNKIEGICADTGGIVYVYYGDIEQTLQGWGNYLASNPVTFMAVLATPIETALSAEELAAYAALHTNYPNTTILNDGGAGMEVQYVADTKLYIDNRINAMAAAIVNA